MWGCPQKTIQKLLMGQIGGDLGTRGLRVSNAELVLGLIQTVGFKALPAPVLGHLRESPVLGGHEEKKPR